MISKTLKAKLHYFRTEHQFRTSIHAHGLIWLEEPGPGICALADICKKGRQAEIYLERMDHSNFFDI